MGYARTYGLRCRVACRCATETQHTDSARRRLGPWRAVEAGAGATERPRSPSVSAPHRESPARPTGPGLLTYLIVPKVPKGARRAALLWVQSKAVGIPTFTSYESVYVRGRPDERKKNRRTKKAVETVLKKVLWQQGCGLCAVCPTSQRPPSPTSARPGKHGLWQPTLLPLARPRRCTLAA